jgi:flavin-dependent dehydrogenase
VIVLECAARPCFRIGETVPPDIRPLLERLGVWPEFTRQGHLRSAGSASAWGTDELAWSDAFAQPLGGGWHLDRPRFDSLLARAAQRAGAEVRTSARAHRIGRHGAGGWSVDVASDKPSSLRARFLVDATGRGATVARRLGAAWLCDDRLVCAYAVVEGCAPEPERRSLVESTEAGWWYATPLPGRRALAGFFTDPRTCRAGGYGRPGPWHDALRATRHVCAFLERPARPAHVGVVAATPHCLDRAGGDAWVAIGDAATSYDPLASAGLTLALRSACDAADALVDRANGDTGALDRYSRSVHRRFVGYRVQRRAYYALETRWPESSFWRRRA